MNNLLVLLLISVGLPAFLLVVALSFPGTVVQAEKSINSQSYRLLGWGLAAALMISSGLILLAAIAKPLAFIVLLIVGLIMACGLTAAVNHLARRLFNSATNFSNQSMANFSLPRASTAVPQLRQFFMASVILELAMALPLLGWFVAIPGVMLFALGAGCAALWQQWQATADVKGRAEHTGRLGRSQEEFVRPSRFVDLVKW
jgi:hypothetical protein